MNDTKRKNKNENIEVEAFTHRDIDQKKKKKIWKPRIHLSVPTYNAKNTKRKKKLKYRLPLRDEEEHSDYSLKVILVFWKKKKKIPA